MRAGKRMWIIGLFILLTVSVSAYALTLPSFGNLAGISDLGGGFLPLIGKAFVNGGIIFIVVAGFANLFSMFENKKPQTGTIMYAMMFAVSLVAAMFLFGNDFVWQHELVRNIVNRWVLVNGLMFFALGFGITNMPFFNKYKGESKGGQAATALITIALAVFLARYFDNLYTNTYFWQMPWFGLLGTVFRNFPVFIGMSVIYYFIMGVLMEKTKGIGQPGRIALAVFLGFQAALDGMDMIQVWKLGYGVVLLSVYRISVGQGNWLAFGMAFAIANILGMVARTQTWSLSDSFPWVELGFFKSFITGAIVGFLFDKARKSKMLKWNKDKEDIERERKEAEERWRRQYDLAVKGFMKKIETADPKVIVYLRKDMGELALLVRRKEALPIGSPEWNRVMFGVEGYPTIADYEPRYERLKGARKALVDRTEAEAPTNLKDIKKEAKAVENVSRRIDEEKEALLKGKIIGHQIVTNRNPVYSAKLKTIMGIIMHAELEVRRIMEEQEKEKEVLTGW